MQCTNYLKQLGLACHTRHDATKYFPSSNRAYELVVEMRTKHTSAWVSDGGIAHRNMVGYTPFLLPYIEQTALYERFIQVMDNDDDPGGTRTNPVQYFRPYQGGTEAEASAIWNVRISTLICPSAPNSTNSPTETGKISYRCCRGDVFQRYDNASGRGIFDPGGGVTGARRIGIVDIVDGTSNTLLLAECNLSPTAGSKKYKEGVASGLTELDGSHRIINPQDCMNAKGSNGDYAQGITVSSIRLGGAWGGPNAFNTQFFTILPPNSPSCYGGHDGWMLVSASSRHTGGINAALADGSVQFISDTIEARNLDISALTPIADYVSKTTGISRHGAWGALGTSSGGESTSF